MSCPIWKPKNSCFGLRVPFSTEYTKACRCTVAGRSIRCEWNQEVSRKVLVTCLGVFHHSNMYLQYSSMKKNARVELSEARLGGWMPGIRHFPCQDGSHGLTYQVGTKDDSQTTVIENNSSSYSRTFHLESRGKKIFLVDCLAVYDNPINLHHQGTLPPLQWTKKARD